MARKPDLRALMDNADDASNLLAALAHKQRLLTLCILTKGEMRVGTLANEIDACHSSTSFYLGALKAQGLVSGRRDGTATWYSVSSPRVAPILATLTGTYLGSEAGHRQTDKRAAGSTKTTVS